MKLAELLMERAECQKRIAQLSKRLQDSAIVQEGDRPPVSPEAVILELEKLHVELEAMIQRINRTNVSVEFEPNVSMADAIVRRDLLRSRRDIYATLSKAAQIDDMRYSHKEIRFVATIDAAEAIRKTDELAREVRMLDARIQAKNWEIEVA